MTVSVPVTVEISRLAVSLLRGGVLADGRKTDTTTPPAFRRRASATSQTAFGRPAPSRSRAPYI